jgi:hypothetical protein
MIRCLGTIAAVSDTLVSIGVAARHVGRSIGTLRRWERVGIAPEAQRVNGYRRYSEADLAKLKEIAERPLLTDSVTATKPWIETEAETVTPWAETAGGMTETKFKTAGALPETCACGRSLVRHLVGDPFGRRWMSASCERHGLQKRVPWK